jgi:hypothetical protein
LGVFILLTKTMLDGFHERIVIDRFARRGPESMRPRRITLRDLQITVAERCLHGELHPFLSNAKVR